MLPTYHVELVGSIMHHHDVQLVVYVCGAVVVQSECDIRCVGCLRVCWPWPELAGYWVCYMLLR